MTFCVKVKYLFKTDVDIKLCWKEISPPVVLKNSFSLQNMVYHYDNYSWKLICNECDILPIRLWSVLRIRTLPPHTRCKQYIGNIDRSNLSHYDFMYTIIKINKTKTQHA